jgi:hypothetical protein
VTGRKVTHVAPSVRARLRNLAQRDGRPYNELEQYYALERLLYRLGRSPHADRFVLKGALMLRAWGGARGRATRDIDLLARMPRARAAVVAAVRDWAALDVPDDGVQFDPASVVGEDIRRHATYLGVRVRVRGLLGTARLALQVDVGFGDAVVPAPAWLDYPVLLDGGAPRLLGYAPETAIAEKFEAMVDLDLANSRLKDFYDVAWLAAHLPFDGPRVTAALRATFARRAVPLPGATPPALTPAFTEDRAKRAQWAAFVRKLRLPPDTPGLDAVAAALRDFLLPPVAALVTGTPFEQVWPVGGPWQPRGP